VIPRTNHPQVVLSLIFLKLVSDKSEERRAELIDEGKEKYVDMAKLYTMMNVSYLLKRWRSRDLRFDSASPIT